MKNFRRTKYNFSNLNVGDEFTVAATDLYSMKNCARHFNKTHGKNIELEIVGEEKKGEFTTTYKIRRTC